MRLRVIAGMVLNLVAIVVPVAWLYVVYGPSALVDANSLEDTAALAGTTAVAFVLGLCASKISQPKNSSPLDRLTEMVHRIHTETRKEEAHTYADV